MIIFKLGGSLANDSLLKEWADLLATYGAGKAVIVPGGGPFADQVRQAQEHWHFRDPTAHRMALLGMDQFAHLMTGISRNLVVADSLEIMREYLKEERTPVWLPSRMVLADTTIEESWDVTSDSLSAWLAQCLPALRLVLVKSRAITEPKISLTALTEMGMVDGRFAQFVAEIPACELHILHKEELKAARELLAKK
jgi:5-(aminomethyl)-3-furanmethanol phosphate kinase